MNTFGHHVTSNEIDSRVIRTKKFGFAAGFARTNPASNG